MLMYLPMLVESTAGVSTHAMLTVISANRYYLPWGLNNKFQPTVYSVFFSSFIIVRIDFLTLPCLCFLRTLLTKNFLYYSLFFSNCLFYLGTYLLLNLLMNSTDQTNSFQIFQISR